MLDKRAFVLWKVASASPLLQRRFCCCLHFLNALLGRAQEVGRCPPASLLCPPAALHAIASIVVATCEYIKQGSGGNIRRRRGEYGCIMRAGTCHVREDAKESASIIRRPGERAGGKNRWVGYQ